eukprot:1333652-Pyramimonas_sp.AAC.1
MRGKGGGRRKGRRGTKQLKPMIVTLVADAYRPLLLTLPSPPAEIQTPWFVGMQVGCETS